MVNNTLYALLNSALAESMGEHAITIKDTSTFVSAGKEVLSTDNNKEQFYQKLADRISAVWVDYKALRKEDSNIRKNEQRFGMALQVISVARMNRAKSNGSWGAQANPFSKEYDTTDIEVRYYSKRGTFEGDTKLVYDYQLYTAFTSENEMMNFIQAIFTDMENGMEMAKRSLDNEVVATMIATALDANGKAVSHSYTVNGETVTDTIAPRTAINLLAEYNSKFSKSLTVENCMHDEDFNLYASAQIDLFVKKLQKPKSIYNPAINETWTEKEKLSLRMLSEFVTNFDKYLKSKIFHDNFVSLPMYDEVDSWQGAGDSDMFADTSKIAIKLEDGTEVVKSGIVAVLSDADACGTMYTYPRIKSMYNGASELTNYYPKCDYGAYVLPNHNCVVFYIANEYEVSLSYGEGGKIAPSTTQYVEKGNDLTITIIPDEGFALDDIKLDGTSVKSNVSGNTYTLENVTTGHAIAVTFKKSSGV